ncbi:MAG: hypothetical protein EOO27_39945 [Comamonadaceae bacterium]|nr:MAG: hypothetical protein EOO27_39945 [Comamonadaceae bacterium]
MRCRRDREARWRKGKRRGHTEAEQLFHFAQAWAPYGGAPREEILVRFGMTPARFAERLREALSEIPCGPETRRRMHAISAVEGDIH